MGPAAGLEGFVVQICKGGWAPSLFAGVCSGPNGEIVRGLGADEVRYNFLIFFLGGF